MLELIGLFDIFCRSKKWDFQICEENFCNLTPNSILNKTPRKYLKYMIFPDIYIWKFPHVHVLNISKYQITGEYFIITMNISNLYQIYMIFPFLIYIKINSYICADISFNLLKSLYIYVQLFLKKCIAVFWGWEQGKPPPPKNDPAYTKIQSSDLYIYLPYPSKK